MLRINCRVNQFEINSLFIFLFCLSFFFFFPISDVITTFIENKVYVFIDLLISINSKSALFYLFLFFSYYYFYHPLCVCVFFFFLRRTNCTVCRSLQRSKLFYLKSRKMPRTSIISNCLVGEKKGKKMKRNVREKDKTFSQSVHLKRILWIYWFFKKNSSLLVLITN